MATITVHQSTHVRLDGGRSVVLNAGGRDADQTSAIQALIPKKKLEELAKAGVLSVDAEA